MKFSTRTTYGLRAMIRLAGDYQKENISLTQIAKEENISLKYLERLFAKLKKGNLVSAEKGVTGGYRLTKNPSDVRVFDIVKILEGDITPFHCLSDSGEIVCSQKCNCGATSVLLKVQNAINKTLKEITLKDLI